MKALPKPVSAALVRRVAKSLAKYKDEPIARRQQLVYSETGEKPFDVVPPTPDFKERANAIGKQICDVEMKQDKAREVIHQLRQRYERDCYLLGILPIRTWEEAAPSSTPVSGPGASLPEQPKEGDLSAPPDSVHSEQSTPPQT